VADSLETTTVAIVGAGPTGLTLACDLARRGVQVTVVDKAVEFFTGSRGKTISPRTMEVFDDLGVAPQVIAGGLLNIPMRSYDKDKVIHDGMVNRDSDPDPSVPYPLAVFVPQYRTESILRERLSRYGVSVKREHEVIGIDHTDDGVRLSIQNGATTRHLDADYVVGCDGGHSATRRLIGLSFDVAPDESAKYSWVGDVRVEGLDLARAHRWNDPRRGMLLLSPFKDTDLWQFQFLPADGTPTLGKPDLDGFRRIWEDWTGEAGNRVVEATSASRFRINEHIADHYRVGRVFLAGDAAHVYSPAGGQGMTTGIQDAYNLGWKIAAVLAGAPAVLLDTYEAERRPVAEHALAFSRQRWQHVNDALTATEETDVWQLVINEDTSQLGISYRGGPLAPPDSPATSNLRPGDRAPDGHVRTPTGKHVRLFDFFRGPHWTVLSFDDRAGADFDLPFYWGSAVNNHAVGNLSGAEEVQNAYGADRGMAVVVRPDGYIAAVTIPTELASGAPLLPLEP
jgi:2-polyprenyl-6-methoxyphenol hydroxylase-like FAD-dependent oxidoreductase